MPFILPQIISLLKPQSIILNDELMSIIKNKLSPKENRSKKQKTIIWAVVIFTIINILLVLGFFIYLYFWIKKH